MRALGPLAFACALLAPLVANAQPGGPLETAMKFFEAKSCAEAWSMYSSRTQENIRAEVRRREREREGASLNEKPEDQYCIPRGKLKRGSVRIARQQGDEAVVAAEFTVRVVSDRRLLPGSMVQTEELRLIREAGAWRVERPRAAVTPRFDQLTEVGPVDVRLTPGGGGLHSTLEATAIVPTKRAPLEAALGEPMLWATALPSVTAVESLGREGEQQRLRLTFAGTDQSITILARPVSRPRNSMETDTAVFWHVEGGPNAAPYARGSWVIKPYPDGTRIILKLVFDPRPWRKGVGTEVFSVERAGQAVLALEKSALQPAR